MFEAAEAKRRELWDHTALALAWVINRMPNMSSKTRPPIHPDSIHPYRKSQSTTGVPLRTSNPMAETALDAWMDDSNAMRRG